MGIKATSPQAGGVGRAQGGAKRQGRRCGEDAGGGDVADTEFVETEIRGPMTDADAIAAEAVARLKADGALRLLGTA